jgi:hypothetical protein
MTHSSLDPISCEHDTNKSSGRVNTFNVSGAVYVKTSFAVPFPGEGALAAKGAGAAAWNGALLPPTEPKGVVDAA